MASSNIFFNMYSSHHMFTGYHNLTDQDTVDVGNKTVFTPAIDVSSEICSLE